jgi:peptidoglycan hydrolase CwlO-like protein
LRKFVVTTDSEDSLQKMDRLSQEEARMGSVESLKVTYNVDPKVMGVDNRVKGVEGKVEDVQDDVQDVGSKVQNVDGRVQDVQGDVHDVGNKVQDVDDRVQGVNDKLEQVDRSLLSNPCSSYRGLRYHYREPAQRQPLTMAFAVRSIHQS